MLVGTTNIDYGTIKEFANQPEDLVRYVENHIPVWARHIPCLAHNQRFYVALHLRNVLTLPFKTRKEMTDALIDGINIRGLMSSFTSITDILDACDKDALLQMLYLEVEKSE